MEEVMNLMVLSWPTRVRLDTPVTDSKPIGMYILYSPLHICSIMVTFKRKYMCLFNYTFQFTYCMFPLYKWPLCPQ